MILIVIQSAYQDSKRAMQPKSAIPKPKSPALLAVAAVAFGIGVWLAGQLHRPASLWAVAAALLSVCAIVAAVKVNIRLGYVSVLLALVCSGAFARLLSPSPRVVQPPLEFLQGEEVEIIGHVINDGSLRAGSEPRERFDLETEVIQNGESKFTEPVGIRATLFAKRAEEDQEEEEDHQPEFPQLVYGSRIKFTAKLKLPHNFGNPGTFDYVSYLHGLGLSTLASVHSDKLELLPGYNGSWLGGWRSRVRRSILDHIFGLDHKRPSSLWSHEDAVLFAAMIVGDDSLLLRHVREEFQETGVYHLLVVSGMNVGILAFAIFWTARRLRAPAWAASVVTIVLSVFYAYIAGMGVPIQRAVLMLAVYLVTRLLYRERATLNATGFAALAVMIWSPDAWFEPAFQLVFLALLAIFGIGVPIVERTTEPYRKALRHLGSTNYDLSLPPRLAQFRLDMRLIAGRMARFAGKFPARILTTGLFALVLAVCELVIVSSITQAVVVLPMRLYFHRAALVGLPANVLVLPLAGLLMNSAVAAIGLSYISFPLARVAGKLASSTLHLILFCITSISHWTISQWRIPDANFAIGFISVIGIVLAVFAVRRTRVLAWAGIIVLFASGALAALYRPVPRIVSSKLEVTAIDVGQGDSLLVISPQGQTMLIDGGGTIGPFRGEFDFGEDVVSPYLWFRRLYHLDVVALSHAHDDHIGGLARIIENFHPQELWVGINPETPALKRLYRVAASNHVQIRSHVAGEAFDWSGTHIRVLSPPADWHPKPEPKNDDSLSFLISYGHTTALLAGDLEKKMEKFVAAESPQAELLKVAHHGSATSTTPELLDAVHPLFAVISVGFHNSFGHPRQAVLERLQRAQVKTYRTDRLGAITFLLDGTNVEPKCGSCP
ncbi:MAG TPA: DNA internalization-related competence protein ComEC/Rec2 [Candidatus Angelobacter sp.]|nr:DNA internalization-related competence protein ComEC/Rec2 [Candidatus Angelobacter sp.]